MSTEIRTAADRIAVIAPSATDARRESLRLAAEAGADDATLRRLAAATRLSRFPHIDLPARYAGLSRSKGWARLGRGDAAQWGEESKGGFRVATPGTWTTYSSDGFSREKRETWKVERVTIGSLTWTIAS